MTVKVSFQLIPQHGDMKPMRDAWVKAEELGVDRIYTADHFHTQIYSDDVFEEAAETKISSGKNFEAMTIQAAMAATTSRVEIGCIVHANSYRNPNLTADMARTIDHISNGRFVLGMGAGYMQPDYDEYGYEFGTPKSRMLALQRDMPIIRARLETRPSITKMSGRSDGLVWVVVMVQNSPRGIGFIKAAASLRWAVLTG